MKLHRIVFQSCLPVLLLGYGQLHAAASLAKVVMTSGSASERDGVLYVAQDLGLFRNTAWT